MITDMTIMLYVTDVPAAASFWEAVGFSVAMRQPVSDDYETVLLMYGEQGAAIQLYDIDFIRATQPQLADKRPVLLFSADVIDDLYTRILAVSHQVSPLTVFGDQHVFTFADPDDNVFTLMGELVDVPATDEDLAEFDRNTAALVPIRFSDVDRFKQPAYIFFGRKSCPWCRRMAREFPGVAAKIYWVDTEGSDYTAPVRQRYGVATVPTLIKRASTGQYVSYDSARQSVEAFLGEE